MKTIYTFFLFCCTIPMLCIQNVRVTVEGQLLVKRGAAEKLILQSDVAGWGRWVSPIHQQRKIIDVKDFGAIKGGVIDNVLVFQLDVQGLTGEETY